MRFLIFLPIIFVILFIPLSSFAQVQSSIVITTDKSSYSEGEIIIITGEVRDLLSGTPVSMIVVSPDGNLAGTKQISVGADKKFSTKFAAGGALMKVEGTYTITVQYGNESRSATTSFEFGGVMEDQTTEEQTTESGSIVTDTTVSIQGSTDLIGYEITGGKIISIMPDVDANSLIISIDATDDGSLTVTIPRSVLDATFNGEDDDFFVLVDAEEVDHGEVISSVDRTLSIPLKRGVEEIKIIGNVLLGNEDSSEQVCYGCWKEDAQASTSQGMSITATADQGSDIITVTGTVVSDVTDVTFRVTSPSGNNVVAVDQVSPDDDGNFATIFEIKPTWSGDGLYEIQAMQSITANSLYTLSVYVEVNSGMAEQTSVTESNLETGIYEPILPNPEPPSYPTPTSDMTPPIILKPTDITVNAENQNGAVVSFDVLAIDDTDDLVNPTCSPSSRSFFAIGETRVICNARDSAGNRAVPVSFNVIVNAQGTVIPEWVKNVASFWCDDKIDDTSFIEGIQYLIDNNIISVSITESNSGLTQDVPLWVKNNACWWSKDLISDKEFSSGIEFLVKSGVIRI